MVEYFNGLSSWAKKHFQAQDRRSDAEEQADEDLKWLQN